MKKGRAMQTCAPFALKRTGMLSPPRPRKKATVKAAFLRGRGDGITRSHLCLYMRFRLFMSAEIISAFRSARQVCADLRHKLAHPLSYTKRVKLSRSSDAQKRTAKMLPFFVVEVTGFEPTTSWSRTKRATKLRYTSFSFPINLPHREDIVNR